MNRFPAGKVQLVWRVVTTMVWYDVPGLQMVRDVAPLVVFLRPPCQFRLPRVREAFLLFLSFCFETCRRLCSHVSLLSR